MKPSTTSRDNERAQVTLLAGFLGAGKTTLLKRILAWETDLSGTAVIVNEFGSVGIDGSMLEDSAANMVEFKSGCVCCVLKAEFNIGLKKIWNELKPKRILIEASGVADPDSIKKVFEEVGIREHMEVTKVVTVLDADFWEARNHLGPLFFHQLEDADLILLNKIDLIGEEKVPLMLKELHETIPGTQVIPTRHCAVDPETLWSIDHQKDFGMEPGEFFDEDHHDHDPKEHERYVPFYFIDTAPLNDACFQNFTQNLPWEVFRMKGTVHFKNGTRMINFVGGKSEWIDWEDTKETRLAFVGMWVNPDEILRDLKNCIDQS